MSFVRIDRHACLKERSGRKKAVLVLLTINGFSMYMMSRYSAPRTRLMAADGRMYCYLGKCTGR